MGGDSLKPGPTPYEQFLPLPTPCFKMFLERSLNDPHHPTSSIFHCYPPPPLKILIIQWYTKGTDHFLHFKIVSFREVFSTFPEKIRGKNIVNNWRQNPVLVGLIQVWMNKISNTAYTISVRD